MLQARVATTEELRLLALRALTTLPDDRTRLNQMLTALGWHSQVGLLPSILGLALPALASGEAHPVYNAAVVERALHLVLSVHQVRTRGSHPNLP
jgi:hypothetical protein